MENSHLKDYIKQSIDKCIYKLMRNKCSDIDEEFEKLSKIKEETVEEIYSLLFKKSNLYIDNEGYLYHIFKNDENIEEHINEIKNATNNTFNVNIEKDNLVLSSQLGMYIYRKGEYLVINKCNGKIHESIDEEYLRNKYINLSFK